ncbi:Uncharacterised protein [Neisseria gonorrhoeae]|nr:Uncharacterised protein [Neisseria gonorrhoeae]CNP43627.1 Uncharacterised protein [Neisseria gonorrhoeae]CNP59228.1 Uncharacterised protein [Neisseria gonorrhoeae]CNP81591.1 Uncharacterised protein [Neisseria gonorrhoeae]CNP90231.1 Uncharacterised protein [Neisseria gonorrhoeae]
MFLPAQFDLAQDKAAVHAVAVAHIAFFGKGAQLFGKGGFLALNILARHRAGDVAELQIVAAFITAAVFFEDMHHPVVRGGCQIPADRDNRAVDDVAQIAIAVVVADAVSLAVFFWFLVN